MTANGEVFDRHSIAAAHPTLPLPSYVRVTNLENHSSMIVRVNDRGPYHAGRVMDVSEETAEALGFHRRGTARVRVEYVGKASLAGSDDRKLLATLRTDGQPAGSRSAVMVADLGPVEETEKFSRGRRRWPTSRPRAGRGPRGGPAPPRPRADRAGERRRLRAGRPAAHREPHQGVQAGAGPDGGGQARPGQGGGGLRLRRQPGGGTCVRQGRGRAGDPPRLGGARAPQAGRARRARRDAGLGQARHGPAQRQGGAGRQGEWQGERQGVREAGGEAGREGPEPPARSGGHGTRYAGIY